MTANKLPEVAPCPCGKQCETAVAPWCNELWYVVSQCGFSGPQRSSERAAILAWNRRAPDGDAERRGGREILKELQVHAEEWTLIAGGRATTPGTW